MSCGPIDAHVDKAELIYYFCNASLCFIVSGRDRKFVSWYCAVLRDVLLSFHCALPLPSLRQSAMNAGGTDAPGALPLMPETGIVTLVPDEWYGPWSTRHYLMNRLARCFPIAWVAPPCGSRESIALIAQPKPDQRSPGADPAAAITIYNPRWLPKLYKPRPVAELFERLRHAGAARLLLRRGCTPPSSVWLPACRSSPWLRSASWSS